MSKPKNKIDLRKKSKKQIANLMLEISKLISNYKVKIQIKIK